MTGIYPDGSTISVLPILAVKTAAPDKGLAKVLKNTCSPEGPQKLAQMYRNCHHFIPNINSGKEINYTRNGTFGIDPNWNWAAI
ncbi:MAG: hypothetical protein IPM98_12765 [Lewinellaceae bacterium]|nr:hypothetical protein [Lewinellaceae bacterium]